MKLINQSAYRSNNNDKRCPVSHHRQYENSVDLYPYDSTTRRLTDSIDSSPNSSAFFFKSSSLITNPIRRQIIYTISFNRTILLRFHESNNGAHRIHRATEVSLVLELDATSLSPRHHFGPSRRRVFSEFKFLGRALSLAIG